MRTIFDKLNIHNKDDFIRFLVQFVKFGLVGVSNTAISLIIYYALVYCGINYIIANTIGFVVSVFNAYYWNKKYVFNAKNNKSVNIIIRTYISYGGTFLLSTGLLFIMVNIFYVSELVAPLINLLLTIPLNFLLNKFWTFR